MKKIFILFLTSFIFIINIAFPANAAVKTIKYKVLSSYSYTIPYLNTSFVPQGLCKTTYRRETYRLITAYDYNKSKNSRIYIMNSNGKHLKTIYISNSAGAHVGGIVEYKSEIWIVSTNKIYLISKGSLFNAQNNSTITPRAILTDNNISTNSRQGNLSFCTMYNDTLWIGTFNEKNPSKAYGYQYYESTKTLKHVATMNIPAKCQGMAFLNSTTVFFSTSYGKADSNIYKYTIKSSKNAKTGFTTYTLNQQVAKIVAPSRSQEIYITPSQNLYVLFESGSKVYTTGRRESKVVLIDL